MHRFPTPTPPRLDRRAARRLPRRPHRRRHRDHRRARRHTPTRSPRPSSSSAATRSSCSCRVASAACSAGRGDLRVTVVAPRRRRLAIQTGSADVDRHGRVRHHLGDVRQRRRSTLDHVGDSARLRVGQRRDPRRARRRRRRRHDRARATSRIGVVGGAVSAQTGSGRHPARHGRHGAAGLAPAAATSSVGEAPGRGAASRRRPATCASTPSPHGEVRAKAASGHIRAGVRVGHGRVARRAHGQRSGAQRVWRPATRRPATSSGPASRWRRSAATSIWSGSDDGHVPRRPRGLVAGRRPRAGGQRRPAQHACAGPSSAAAAGRGAALAARRCGARAGSSTCWRRWPTHGFLVPVVVPTPTRPSATSTASSSRTEIGGRPPSERRRLARRRRRAAPAPRADGRVARSGRASSRPASCSTDRRGRRRRPRSGCPTDAVGLVRDAWAAMPDGPMRRRARRRRFRRACALGDGRVALTRLGPTPASTTRGSISPTCRCATSIAATIVAACAAAHAWEAASAWTDEPAYARWRLELLDSYRLVH